MLKFTITNNEDGSLNVNYKDVPKRPENSRDDNFKIYLGKSFKIAFVKTHELNTIIKNDFVIHFRKITESNDFKQAIKEYLKSFTENYRLIHLGNLDGYCLVNLDDHVISIEVDTKEVSFLIGKFGANINNLKENYKIKRPISVITRDNDFEQDNKKDNIITDNREKKETLQVDDKVLVWNNDDQKKWKRHFSRFNNEGKLCTFQFGNTSWSNGYSNESVWDNYLIINKD